MSRAIAGCTALLLASCSTPLAQLRVELDPRAEADLDCPATQLTYRELEHVISTTRVRITGCKRTVDYEMVESRWRKASAPK